jgi:hypothetical protein
VKLPLLGGLVAALIRYAERVGAPNSFDAA